MKHLVFLVLAVVFVTTSLVGQTSLSKDQYGLYSVTTLKSGAISGVYDTSAVFKMYPDITKLVIFNVTTAGTVGVHTVQVAPVYNATASSMKWVSLTASTDSIAETTGNAVTSISTAYPYFRIIRGSKGSSGTSAVYVFPNGK